MGGGRGELDLDGKGTLSQGQRLHAAAADLDAVGRLLGKDGSAVLPGIVGGLFGESRLGEYGPETAFPAFAVAWQEEIGVLATALRELHHKIGDGVATTGATDTSTGEGFHSVGGGGTGSGHGGHTGHGEKGNGGEGHP